MSSLRRGGPNALHLEHHLLAVPEEAVVTCVVVFEGQMQGWMAQIALMQSGSQLLVPYASLATTLSFTAR